MDRLEDLTIRECPFCGDSPQSIAVSIRGQLFCHCGAELRSNLNLEKDLIERIVILIKKWNARVVGKKKAIVCKKEVEPCPCCGSVKISLSSDHSSLICECGLRLKPSSDGPLSIPDIIAVWNKRGDSQ